MAEIRSGEGGSLLKANNIVDQGVDGARLTANPGHWHALEFLRPHHKGGIGSCEQ